MYDISYFKAEHPEEVHAFMRAHPFAFICGADENGLPAATQVPILFEEREGKLFLQGHFMKKQDHTNAFYENPNVLLVFSGAHSYVSASWYTNKQEASTWNYQSVHAAGIIRFQDEAFLLRLLTQLTAHFEDEHSPSLVKNIDEIYIHKMMKAIVGFEVEVKSLRHVFKMSQNRDAQSYSNIISHLQEQEGDPKEVARLMKEKNKL